MEHTDKKDIRYFAVPAYAGSKGFESQPHVVNKKGELVAVFETLDECIFFVDAANKW